MPRGYEQEPGLKRLQVPCLKDEITPNQRDSDPSRGVLSHVPRNGVQHIMDFGAPKDETTFGGATTSPASATFCPGRPSLGRDRQVQKRTLAETELPQSIKAQ